MCSEHSWRRSHRSMSLTRVKSMSSAWSARSTAGSPLIPTRSRTQIQGAIIYGLTAALHGEITLKNGRVEQSNFDNYRALYINEVPNIDVHILDSAEAPGGMGEPGTSALPPAIVNAIFAATGVRIRKLPIGKVAVKAG